MKTYLERRVAAVFGLSEEAARGLRMALKAGTDWLKEGTSVVLTGPGLARMAKLAGVELTVDVRERCSREWEEGSGEGESGEGDTGLRTIVVVRTVMNPQIVLGVLKEGVRGKGRGKELLRVRVRESLNMLPDMELKECRHVQADLWEFTGRMPLERGHW